MKHTDARQTLARIDATLRLTETPLWQDPEFQEWEAGQVSDERACSNHYENGIATCVAYTYWPGPHHWLNSTSARLEDTVRASPMVNLFDDHHCICEITGDPEWRGSMRVTAADYPAVVTYGPLMLGPEPGPARMPADVVPV